METLAARIKFARQDCGMSASQFARKVGVSPTCVFNWEAGNTQPKSENIRKICSVLQVHQDFLLPRILPEDIDWSAMRIVEAPMDHQDSLIDELKALVEKRVGSRPTKINLEFS